MIPIILLKAVVSYESILPVSGFQYYFKSHDMTSDIMYKYIIQTFSIFCFSDQLINFRNYNTYVSQKVCLDMSNNIKTETNGDYLKCYNV